MSLFDLAGGLLLIVSALIGWFRGAAREVATVGALAVAAIVALFALRFSGPVARAAIHTLWLANIAAILLVFAAVYILLRVLASGLTRRLHQTAGLGGLDRILGGAIGVVRALVVLGLANLTLTAIIPPDRMPAWISGALLYPMSSVAADGLKAFAPQGAKLARQVAPVVGKAITDNPDDNAIPSDDQNRPIGADSNAPRPRVEKTR